MSAVVSEKQRGQGVPFSRIRRITGYLVGDLSTWGSAKLAEEKQRQAHVHITSKPVKMASCTTK